MLLPGDLGDIARGASAIVRGTVVDVRCDWADDRRRVETIVTLRVSESLKGDMRGLVSVKVPGGVLGRYRSVTVGAPSFRQGEEVVLFLGATPPRCRTSSASARACSVSCATRERERRR